MSNLKWDQVGGEHHLYRNGIYKGKVECMGLVTRTHFKIYEGDVVVGSDKSILSAKIRLEKKIEGNCTLGEVTISIKGKIIHSYLNSK